MVVIRSPRVRRHPVAQSSAWFEQGTNVRPDKVRCVPSSWTEDLQGKPVPVSGNHSRKACVSVFTIRTIFNTTLGARTYLPKPVGRPLLIAPEAGKIEPTDTLRRLTVPSGSGAGPNGDRAVRRTIPETSEILGDVPNGSLVRLVFQNVKRDVRVIMISGCLDTSNQYCDRERGRRPTA